MKVTKLVSVFPGCGKSYFYKNTSLKVLDSDSSKFDKKNFPENYMEHIKDNIGKVDIILISSHKIVREALLKNKLSFILVYPEKNLKEDYIKRCKERGNTKKFVELLNENWDIWMEELENQDKCKHIILEKDEYLSDIVSFF